MILVSFEIYKLEFLGGSALGFGFLWVDFMVCLAWFLFDLLLCIVLVALVLGFDWFVMFVFFKKVLVIVD